MNVFDNGGFIGRTADYGDTSFYNNINIIHLQSQDLFEPDATSFSGTFDVSGTDASDVLVICGGGEANITTTNITVNSIVINGVTASAIAQTNYNLNQGLAVGIFAIVASDANIDSNTTNVTVTINFNNTFRRTGLSVYRLTGTNGIIPSFTTDIDGVNASAATVSTSASADSATIAVVYNNDFNLLTPASTDLSIDYQSTEVEPNNGSYGVASKISSVSETLTTTGAVDTNATVAAQVTFQCAGIAVFADTFETFSGWTTQGSGVLSQSSTQAYAGTYSAIKTTNGDPNGAYKLLDATVNRKYLVEAWIFSEDPRAGGSADRISIVDSSGNGYGLYLGAGVVYCERRDALASTLIADSTWTRPSNAWYRVTLEAKSDNTFVVTTYNTSGTQLATVTSSVDTTHSGPFDRVMILGGANYYVDNLTVTNLETVNKNKKNSGIWDLPAVLDSLTGGTGAGAPLYFFTSNNFTPAGATGFSGPTLAQCQTQYSGQAFLSGYFTVSGSGLQEWTVPETATYSFTVRGAAGGDGYVAGNANNRGGYGAIITGDVTLTQGDVIHIMVGQMGINGTGSSCSGAGGGGGGGTFVYNNTTSTLLFAAGGGGGGATAGGPNTQDASLTNDGKDSSGDAGTVSGGTGGSGGAAGTGCVTGSAGGGGYTGNGTAAGSAPGGQSFTNGGLGGNSSNRDGGFGGGGSTDAYCGGGGGGYSGGAGGGLPSCSCSSLYAGGGGGTYYDASVSNPSVSLHINLAHGICSVSKN